VLIFLILADLGFDRVKRKDVLENKLNKVTKHPICLYMNGWSVSKMDFFPKTIVADFTSIF
jgi:hypothetical protein